MKKINIIPLISLLLITACHAVEPKSGSPLASPLSTNENAVKIDNVYLTFTHGNSVYKAGFTIDDEGINHPLLITESVPSKTPRVQVLTEDISDFFVMQDQVITVLRSGKTLLETQQQWSEHTLKLPINSTVVFSHGQHIIACSPASLLKNSHDRGSCTSLMPNWHIALPWHGTAPKVCNGFLNATVKIAKANQYWKVDINTGDVITPNAPTQSKCATDN